MLKFIFNIYRAIKFSLELSFLQSRNNYISDTIHLYSYREELCALLSVSLIYRVVQQPCQK